MEEQTLHEEERPMGREEIEKLLDSVVRQLEARIDAAQFSAKADDAAREEALKARETTLDRREMTVKTAEALKARGLPEALAEALPFADETGMASALDALESAYRESVQQGVEERLKGDAPKLAPVKTSSDMTDGEYYAAHCRL